MKEKDVKKFASTKHKGLPERKKVKVNEDAKMAKQSDDKLKAHIKNLVAWTRALLILSC